MPHTIPPGTRLGPYEIQSLLGAGGMGEVYPIEGHHALALVVYTVEPSDQDIPAFHTTGTYVLEKTAVKWQIVHAHVCPAREM